MLVPWLDLLPRSSCSLYKAGLEEALSDDSTSDDVSNSGRMSWSPGCYLPAVDSWLAVGFLGRLVVDIGIPSSMQ